MSSAAAADSTTAGDDRIAAFLKTFKCASPLFPNDFNHVITVQHSSTVGDVLKRLTKSKIQAVVVKSDATGVPIYTVSVLDIVGFLMQEVKPEDLNESAWTKIASFLTAEDDRHPLASKTLAELESSQDYELDPVYGVMKDQPLADAVELMIEHGAHRIVVYEDDTFKLNNLITQSRVLAFINAVVDSVPAAKKSIKECGLVGKLVFTVGEDEPAFNAFKTMQMQKVSSVPVMKADGTMAGSVSASDIKLVGYDMQFWRDLSMKAGTFLQHIAEHSEFQRQTAVHRQSLWASAVTPHPRIVTCLQDDTIEHVVNMMVAHRVHRVWVCESYVQGERPRPVGVVSMADVLKVLVKDQSA